MTINRTTSKALLSMKIGTAVAGKAQTGRGLAGQTRTQTRIALLAEGVGEVARQAGGHAEAVDRI